MKLIVFVVNVVCGGLIDEEVLCEVLIVGEIVGVGFDVFMLELFVEGGMVYVLFGLLNVVVILYFGVSMEEV